VKTVKLALVLAFLAALFLPGIALAQTDPSVQGGPARAGLPLASVNSSHGTLQFFQNRQARFQDIASVSNSSNGNNGLGPRFDFVQCSECRTQPAVGGTGPANNPPFRVIANGFVSGPTNTIPSFITSSGPTMEARFPFFFDTHGNPNPNAPNGGVEDLFTVSGRSIAGNCSLQRPSFALAQQTNNIIFRIPTPVFGAANANNNLGISGTFNRYGSDGTIAHFGWEAQNKSLEQFAGEADNVEMGISHEIFTQDLLLPGSEATPAELNFNSLLASQQQDLLNFLRSL
jgi:hypothetical protein